MNRSLTSLRLLGVVVAVTVTATSTGCSIIDRLFLLNADGPYSSHGGNGATAGCQSCGGSGCAECEQGCPDGRCQGGACQTGACQDCPGGVCKTPHNGRYGGLAKHHLTHDEKAALAASDYGATGPAGPPTGAVAYPYYTTRGPRDFLAKRPASIGP
jgi:hypothetical protein